MKRSKSCHLNSLSLNERDWNNLLINQRDTLKIKILDKETYESLTANPPSFLSSTVLSLKKKRRTSWWSKQSASPNKRSWSKILPRKVKSKSIDETEYRAKNKSRSRSRSLSVNFSKLHQLLKQSSSNCSINLTETPLESLQKLFPQLLPEVLEALLNNFEQSITAVYHWLIIRGW